MDKKNIENVRNEVEDYNDFTKTNIGQKSFKLFKIGVIMAAIGFVSFVVLMIINVPKNIPEDIFAFLAVSYLISTIGFMLLALYVGQSQYYNLIKLNNKK